MTTKATGPEPVHCEPTLARFRFGLWPVLLGLLASILLVWPSPAASIGSPTLASGPHVSGEILVKFTPGTTLAQIGQLNAAHGATIGGAIPQLGVLRLRLPRGAAEGGVAAAYLRNPHVQHAEPNYIATAVNMPDDPYFAGGFQWNMTKIQAPQAWDLTTGSPSVAVAVLDTGVDLSHTDLQGKVAASVNFSDSASVTDINGHGTHVAGIAAAATNNTQGVAGLGYNTALMNVKVMSDNGTGSFFSVAEGVVWAADHGARVVNMSLGAQFGNATLEDAINYAWGSGVVMVAAAGNNGNSIPFYPAAYPNVIAVASTDMFDELAPLSNYGDWVAVAAPGGNIYSTLPNNRYASLSGTSVASPHVAGLAGLVFTRVTDSNADGLVNDEVRTCIEHNADDIGITGIGGGRINALGSVQCSSGAPLPSPTPTATATPPPAPTATATPPPAPTATATPPPAPTATATPPPAPTATATPPPAPTATATPPPAPTATATASPSVGDETAPQVALQEPNQGQTVEGNVSLTATASDDTGVVLVSFYVDGEVYKADKREPYSTQWQSRKWSNGQHTITARAVDAAGNMSEETHTVTVQN